MCKWATYTRFSLGKNNIATVDTYPEVQAIIQQTIDGGSGELIGNSVEGALHSILMLSIGENVGFEFQDGTRMLVQRIGKDRPPPHGEHGMCDKCEWDW